MMSTEDIIRELKLLRLKFNKFTCGNITHLNINCIPEYTNDAAATTGNLKAGDIYRTTTGGSTFLKIIP